MNQREKKLCDRCENMEFCSLHSNLWLCNPCWIEEQKAKIESFNFTQAQANAPVESPASHISPLPINSILREASDTDTTIQVRSDIFNAKIKAINAIRDTIAADENITNKPYALAEFLKTRFIHLKSVIFEHNQVIVDASNEQKAIQTYLNELANKLRAEEREKLRIQDINYNPAKPKSTRVKADKPTVKAPPKNTKADKAAIKAVALKYGISEFTVGMVKQQKGSIEAADAHFYRIKNED